MGYVYEQMTMDDVNKVIEDMPPNERGWLTGTRGAFRHLLDADEKNRELLLSDWPWAIDRERGYYVYRRPFLPDSVYCVFYFNETSYFVSINKSRENGIVGLVSSKPNPPEHLKEKFQAEFIEAWRVLNVPLYVCPCFVSETAGEQ